MVPVTRTYRFFSMLLITSFLLIVIAPLSHVRCETMSASKGTTETRGSADSNTSPTPCHSVHQRTIADAFVRTSCCCDVSDTRLDFTVKATPEKDAAKRKLLPSLWVDVVTAESTLESYKSNSPFPPLIAQAALKTVKGRYLLYAALLI